MTSLRGPARARLALVLFGVLAAGADGAGAGHDGSAVAVFEAESFGAAGDGVADDRPALQAAIDAAVAAGRPAAVRFGRGRTYRLGPNPDSVAALSIVRGRDLRLEGNGSLLLAHPSSRILSVFESERIAIRDLTLDFDPLPYTQGRVRSVDGGAVRIAIDHGYPEPVEGGPEIYRDHKSSDCVFLDGATGRFNHEWRRVCRVEPLSGGEWRVSFHTGGKVRPLTSTGPGDRIALKILYPSPPLPRTESGRYLATGSGNLQIGFSSDVAVSNVTSYAAPGMTLVAHGSEAVRVTALSVVRKPGTDRLIAGCSDGAHMKSLTVMPQFRDCVFEGLMDDSINIKVSAQKVAKIEGARILMRHFDIAYNDIVVRPGFELEFANADLTRFLGLATARRVDQEGYRSAWVEVDRVPAGLQTNDLVYIRPRTPALVSNCVFRTQLKTAVLTRPATRIVDCGFADIAYGVHVAQTNEGIEGPSPRGVTVERCRFARPWIAAVALHVRRFDIVPPGLPGIRVETCEFDLSGRGVAVRGSMPVVDLRNLVIRAPDAAGRDAWVSIKARQMTPERIAFVETGPGVFALE